MNSEIDTFEEKSESLAAPEPVSEPESLDDIFGDTAGTPGIDSLRRITDLVHQVQAYQASVSLWEQKIEKAKEDIKTLLERTIPDAMAEVNMSYIELNNDMGVRVEPFHRGSITEKTKAAAHKWLEENGFGGLVKREVQVSFARDAEGVEGLRAYLREFGLTSKEKEAVNYQTLQAFIRNQAEKGEPVPAALFNVFSGRTTKFTKG